MVTILGMVTVLPNHLGWPYICELSQHTKSQPPSMPGSGLKVCRGGGGWVGGVQTHFSYQPKSRLINEQIEYSSLVLLQTMLGGLGMCFFNKFQCLFHASLVAGYMWKVLRSFGRTDLEMSSYWRNSQSHSFRGVGRGVLGGLTCTFHALLTLFIHLQLQPNLGVVHL